MQRVHILLSLLALAACQPASDETAQGTDSPARTDAAPPAPAGSAAMPQSGDTDIAPDKPAAAPARLPRTPAPDGARVFIIEPKPGLTLSSPVHVEFGSANVSIVPAGDKTPASGHHHLVINADLPDPNFPIPASENYLHFGTGATSADLDLPPGQYHLKLLLGDALHIPHDPPIYSESVFITVTE